jgi:hypothetical protein
VYRPHTKVEESHFDLLPQLDTDFDRDSSLEYGGDCPSLSSTFFSPDGSTTDSHGHRRPSLASSIHSASPEAFWTGSATSRSPTTHMSFESGTQVSCRQGVKRPAYLSSHHPIFHHLQHEEQDPHTVLWDAPDHASLSLLGSTHDMTMAEAAHPLYQLDVHGLNHGNANQTLTKSMFATPGACGLMVADDMFGLYSASVQPPAETIEPSVAFQGTLPSSPCYKVEPSTPLRGHVPSSVVFSSSPLSVISPRIVPSQDDVDDYSYASLQQALSKTKKQRAGNDRLQRRTYERKRPAGSSSRPKSSPTKTGMECALVIEQNEFACSYPGCIDKHTGKQKRFKRQEHKKRHEKTVHEKTQHTTYRCWVPDCSRGFSRTDNLKSHLRNTHSKRPGVRGNRYVATLDKNSEFYDPDWVGELDKDGYPMSS